MRPVTQEHYDAALVWHPDLRCARRDEFYRVDGRQTVMSARATARTLACRHATAIDVQHFLADDVPARTHEEWVADFDAHVQAGMHAVVDQINADIAALATRNGQTEAEYRRDRDARAHQRTKLDNKKYAARGGLS